MVVPVVNFGVPCFGWSHRAASLPNYRQLFSLKSLNYLSEGWDSQLSQYWINNSSHIVFYTFFIFKIVCHNIFRPWTALSQTECQGKKGDMDGTHLYNKLTILYVQYTYNTV